MFKNCGSSFAGKQFGDIKLGAKYTAKWSVQIAEMIFQTRSNSWYCKKEKSGSYPVIWIGFSSSTAYRASEQMKKTDGFDCY